MCWHDCKERLEVVLRELSGLLPPWQMSGCSVGWNDDPSRERLVVFCELDILLDSSFCYSAFPGVDGIDL